MANKLLKFQVVYKKVALDSDELTENKMHHSPPWFLIMFLIVFKPAIVHYIYMFCCFYLK